MPETTLSPRAGIGGPKTEEGKRRVSMNALKHGFRARKERSLEAIEERSGVKFEELLEEIGRHYLPADPIEEQLVRRIARCLWRLSVASAMEKDILGAHPSARKPNPNYQNVMKYERLVDIHLHRAIHTFMRKRELDRLVR